MSVLALLAVMFLASGSAGAVARKDLTVKEIMGKAHKGPNSLLASVGKELRSDEPDWSDIQTEAKELVTLGTALGKNEPPQGQKASWDKLTKQYLAGVMDLAAAAQRKDKSAAQAAHRKLSGSCRSCHQVHRPS
jgi:cytochrome c556